MVEIFVAIISSSGLVVLIIFFYKEWKFCTVKKTKHDLKLYRKFNSILNDNLILSIIKKTQYGYLPKDAYWQIDTLVEFIQLPENQFLNKKINKLLSNLVLNLSEIAQLYSMCGRCELIGNEYKLIAYKNGDSEEFELLKQSKKYSSNLFQSFKLFRKKIKQNFKI